MLGYKTERICWGTIHSRQKTTCTTQTQYHPKSQKKKWVTPSLSTAEMAKELPFSEEPSDKPWEGSAPTSAVKRSLRKKAAAVAKK